MTYDKLRRKMLADIAARRPTRKAVQAAIDMQRPLDAPPKEPVKRKPRKLSDDDLPEF